MKGLSNEVVLEMARTAHALGQPVDVMELFSVMEEALSWQKEFERSDQQLTDTQLMLDRVANELDRLTDEASEVADDLPTGRQKARLLEKIEKAKAAYQKYDEFNCV